MENPFPQGEEKKIVAGLKLRLGATYWKLFRTSTGRRWANANTGATVDVTAVRLPVTNAKKVKTKAKAGQIVPETSRYPTLTLNYKRDGSRGGKTFQIAALPSNLNKNKGGRIAGDCKEFYPETSNTELCYDERCACVHIQYAKRPVVALEFASREDRAKFVRSVNAASKGVYWPMENRAPQAAPGAAEKREGQ